jgi:hypothetical protein
MGGPIVRTGTTPEFWKNWDRIFDKKKGTKSASPSSGTKKTAGKAAATKKSATKAKAAPKSAKKSVKKKAARGRK